MARDSSKQPKAAATDGFYEKSRLRAGVAAIRVDTMGHRIQVYHHLGLGDHIICNGLIRELCKQYDTVYCFVKERNVASVSFMFRDEPKISLIAVENNQEVHSKALHNVKLITIGREHLDVSSHTFDHSFYKQIGLDFSLRWDAFHVERDVESERELLRKVNPSRLPFVLIHDDPTRGFRIDLNRVRKDIRSVKVSDLFVMGQLSAEYQKYNLFHWIGVLEQAEEIHCMDSALKCLVESLSYIDSKRLFYHRYVRGEGPRKVSSMRKEWTIIRHASLSFRVRTLIDRGVRKAKNELYRFKWVQQGAS